MYVFVELDENTSRTQVVQESYKVGFWEQNKIKSGMLYKVFFYIRRRKIKKTEVKTGSLNNRVENLSMSIRIYC